MEEPQSPINTAARAAAQEVADEHDRRVIELLKKHDLWEDGVKFSEKYLQEKGYILNQIMLPNQEYELVIAKIVETVHYKAVVNFNVEVSDVDTTLEDTPERRAERTETPAPATEGDAPAPAEEDDKAE